MATPGENSTVVMPVTTQIASDASQKFFIQWIQARDNSILPPKEQIAKSRSTCGQFGTHQGNELGRWHPSSHQCPHHHIDRMANRTIENQNRARSVINLRTTVTNWKRPASARYDSREDRVPSDRRPITAKGISASLSCLSMNTIAAKTKSKIPVRTSEISYASSSTTECLTNKSLSPSFGIKRVSSGNGKSRIPVAVSTDSLLLPKTNTVFGNSTLTLDDQQNQQDLRRGTNDEVTTTNYPPANTAQSVLTQTRQPNRFKKQTKMTMNWFETSQSNRAVASAFDQKMNVEKLQESNHDKSKEERFKLLMQKQNELKAYYDSFPNIDDVTNEASPDIKKAKEFTESILNSLPSGDVNDRNTVCHILSKLLGQENQECLFYDSENGIKLHDASMNLADLDSEDRPFVLKLSSSEGLGGRTNVKSEQDDFELVQILTDVIKQKQSHPVLDDITERLAKAHGVDKPSIIIKQVFVGTFNVVYTVLHLAKTVIKAFIQIEKKLKQQFQHFLSAKIHPLLFRPSFDIAYFDKRGNKTFDDKMNTFQVGPPGRTKSYTTPAGWTRYGLKVLGKFEGDTWLHPFGAPENWYRAFHGTGNAQSLDFDDKSTIFTEQEACVYALSGIYVNGFRQLRSYEHGKGVYCSPNPKHTEENYVKSVQLDIDQEKKTFKCMLQVAVNPDGVQCTSNNDIWVVPESKDIRTYGILIKEV